MKLPASRELTACIGLTLFVACAELGGFEDIAIKPGGGAAGVGQGGAVGGALLGGAGGTGNRGGAEGGENQGADGGVAGETSHGGNGGAGGIATGGKPEGGDGPSAGTDSLGGEGGSAVVTTGGIGGVPGAGGEGEAGVATGGGSAGMDGPAGSGGSVVEPCGTNQARNSKTGVCRNCTLNCEELGSRGLHPTTTLDGRCVCATEEGYFFELGGSIGAYPCDSDGDGWVRDSARTYIDSADPVLRENARCTLAMVDEIKLENEDEEEYSLYFTEDLRVTTDAEHGGGRLPLYESVRNDDAVRLAAEPIAVPAYGSRSLGVAELNGFTKACVSANADHNDNGRRDVEEWARLPNDQIDVSPRSVGRDDFLALYTRFSFFVELDVGGFVPRAPDVDERTITGSYYVRERHRDPADDDAFGLVGDPNANEYWRTCQRRRDFAYSPDVAPVTHDFASLSGPSLSADSWKGMRHHSQFKCVEVVPSRALDDPLHRQPIATMLDNGWNANACELQGSTEPTVGGSTNPSLPIVTCRAIALNQLELTDVTWVETGFNAYADPVNGYRRGCVDECGEGIVIPDECYRCDPSDYGEGVTSPEIVRAQCDDNRGLCDGNGNCGPCVPGDFQCRGINVRQRCDAGGEWQDVATCEYDCVPETADCGCFRDIPSEAPSACEVARDMETLVLDETFEVSGRIAEPGRSHWYKVAIPNPRTDTGFVIGFDMARTASTFKFAVQAGCGVDPYRCNLNPTVDDPQQAVGITQWEFKDDCAGKVPGKDCPTDSRHDFVTESVVPKTAYLRVYRTDDAVSCSATYALVFRRP